VLDATAPLSDYEVFPLGRGREPWSAIERADAVVLTRVGPESEQRVSELRERLPENCPIYPFAQLLKGYRHLTRCEQKPADWLMGQTVAAVCGIGAPASFRHLLSKEGGIAEVDLRIFPDHHTYSKKEVEKLIHGREV